MKFGQNAEQVFPEEVQYLKNLLLRRWYHENLERSLLQMGFFFFCYTAIARFSFSCLSSRYSFDSPVHPVIQSDQLPSWMGPSTPVELLLKAFVTLVEL